MKTRLYFQLVVTIWCAALAALVFTACGSQENQSGGPEEEDTESEEILLPDSNRALGILPSYSITITSPNGGESWGSGSSRSIQWTLVGPDLISPFYYTVNLYYSTAGPAGPWTDIHSFMRESPGSRSYSWTVPETPSTRCYLRATAYRVGLADPAFDISNNSFTIVDVTGPPAPTVRSPTHPSQTTWYSDNNPQLIWDAPPDPSGITGYSYTLDQTSSIIPDTTSEGAGTSISYPGMADARLYFHVRARDGAGNWGATAHYTIRIDTTPPSAPTVTSFTHSIEDTWYNNNNPRFTWTTPTDASGIYGYSIILDQISNTTPDTTRETVGTSISYSDVVDGAWYFHVRARDGAGNWGATDHYTIHIDVNPPPAPTIHSSTHPTQNTPYNNNDPAFSWTPPTDASGITGYNYDLNQISDFIPDTTSEGTVTTVLYSNYANGTWYFHVRAVDGTGKWGATAHYTIRIDTTPLAAPSITSSTHQIQTTWYNNNDPQFSWSVSDPSVITGYRHVLDHGSNTIPTAFEGTETSASYSNVADGTWYFHVRARDNAGNWGTTAHYTIRIDTTPPPVPTVTSSTHRSQDIWYNSNDPQFSWTPPADPSGITGYRYTLDQFNSPPPDTTTPVVTGTSVSYSGKTDGLWFFHVRGRDGAGNWGATTHYTIRIDTTPPPAPEITSPTHPDQNIWYNDRNPRFDFFASDNRSGVVGYRHVLDHDPNTTPTASEGTEIFASYSNVADGTWYFHVRARDSAGNWGATAHYTVHIDATAPPLPIIYSLSHPIQDVWYDNNDPQFEWSASDPSGITGYNYGLDQDPDTTPNTAPGGIGTTFHSYSDKADGVWYFHVRAMDGAGRWGETAHYTVRIDTTPPPAPEITSSTHPIETAWYTDNDLQFSWTTPTDASEIIGYSYEIDHSSSTAPNNTSEGTAISKSYTDKSDGTWYFHVKALDGALNWGETAHYTIHIDTTPPPAPTISSPTHPSQIYWYSNNDPQFDWTASDPSGIRGYIYAFNQMPTTLVRGSFGETETASYSDIADGRWYFHVSAMDDTGHLGPAGHYEIRILTNDEDNVLEVLTEWNSDYSQRLCDCYSDLPNSDDLAKGLVDTLVNWGWTAPFGFYSDGHPKYGNNEANDEHFARSDRGGDENSYVDSVDLAIFIGHGGWGWDWYFSSPSPSSLHFTDDSDLVPGQVIHAWGDGDMEWMAFHACKVLDGTNKGRWARAMDGLHLILGFQTNTYDKPYFGSLWVKNMTSENSQDPAQTVAQAWCSTVSKLEPSGTVARVIGDDIDNFNDYLWGQGYVSPDPPMDDNFYRMDCPSSSLPVLSVDPGLGSMVLYRIIPQEINENYVRSVGEVFQLDGEVATDERDVYSMADDRRSLKVTSTGGINYYDLDDIWRPRGTSVSLPTDEETRSIAEEFLTRNNLLPPDAVFAGVDTNVLTEESKSTDEIIEVINLHREAYYSRELGGGLGQFSVVGPGAKLKVYIGNDNQVIGFVGGWRPVTVEDTLSIMSETEARELINLYGSKVAIGGIPHHEELNITDTTLGYYEIPSGADQGYLIPSFIFTADFIVGGETWSSGHIYMPAAEQFIPPVAEITSPADGGEYQRGETVTLAGSALFGTPPYEYSWSSNIDGALGGDQSISTSDLSVAYRDDVVTSHTITLTVTDAEGRTGQAMISLKILPLEELGGDSAGGSYTVASVPVVLVDADGNGLIEQYSCNGGELTSIEPGETVRDCGLRIANGTEGNDDHDFRWDDRAGSPVPTVFVGGPGDDYIAGSSGDDLLLGGPGDDNLDGRQGNDIMSCGSGDDDCDGEGGDDTIHCGEGNDRCIGKGGNDTIYGGPGNDFINGYEGDDTLEGGDGDDYVLGESGADRLDCGEGDDICKGGRDDDEINGGGGVDYCHGSDGNDVIDCGPGEDLVNGYRGDDTVNACDGEADEIRAGENIDTCTVDCSIDADTSCDHRNCCP